MRWRGLDGRPEFLYVGPNPPQSWVLVVTPLRARDIRVRVGGLLRDDVDVRLLAELLLDSWIESEAGRERARNSTESAGLTDSAQRKAGEK